MGIVKKVGMNTDLQKETQKLSALGAHQDVLAVGEQQPPPQLSAAGKLQSSAAGHQALSDVFQKAVVNAATICATPPNSVSPKFVLSATVPRYQERRDDILQNDLKVLDNQEHPVAPNSVSPKFVLSATVPRYQERRDDILQNDLKVLDNQERPENSWTPLKEGAHSAPAPVGKDDNMAFSRSMGLLSGKYSAASRHLGDDSESVDYVKNLSAKVANNLKGDDQFGATKSTDSNVVFPAQSLPEEIGWIPHNVSKLCTFLKTTAVPTDISSYRDHCAVVTGSYERNTDEQTLSELSYDAPSAKDCIAKRITGTANAKGADLDPAIIDKEKLKLERFAKDAMALTGCARIFLPLLLNTAWVTFAGMDTCGGGSYQNLYYYVFSYDTWYFSMKGYMVGLMWQIWQCDLHQPKFDAKDLANPNRWAKFSFVSFYAYCVLIIGLIWGLTFFWAAMGIIKDASDPDTTQEDINLGWLLLKTNVAVAINGSLLAWFWGLYYPVAMRRAKAIANQAFKRFILLSTILTFDFLFVMSSLYYVYFFFLVKEYDLGFQTQAEKDSLMGQVCSTGLEMFLSITFFAVYMPLLGVIFRCCFMFAAWLGVGIGEVKAHLLMYTSGVIIDMHAVMYSRQIFSGLKSTFLFFLSAIIDCMSDVGNFRLRNDSGRLCAMHLDGIEKEGGADLTDTGLSLEEEQAFEQEMQTIGVPNKSGFVYWLYETISVERYLRLARYVYPARWLYPFQMSCSGDPNIPANGAGDTNTSNGKKCVKLAFASEWLWLYELPDIKKVNRARALLAKIRRLETQSDSQKSMIIQRWIYDKELGQAKDSLSVDQLGQLRAPSSRMHSDMGNFEFAVEQARGIVFTRYTTKFCVRFASSFQFLFLHFMVRQVGMSGEILSKVRDMSGDLTPRMILFGCSFLFFDFVAGVNLWKEFQRCDLRVGLQRMGAMSLDPRWCMMIIVCFLCCNSDIFLTFNQAKFCGV